MRKAFFFMVLLFAISLNGQIYVFDKEATTENIFDDIEKTKNEDFFEKYLDHFLDMYILIQKDTIEVILGGAQSSSRKNGIENFDGDIQIINDRIILDEMFLFKSTKKKSVQLEIEAIRKQIEQKTKESSYLLFKTEDIQYDTLEVGEKIKATFKFQNTYSEDLQISRVYNRCNCNYINYPEYEIKPGAKDSITVEYYPNIPNLSDMERLIMIKHNLPGAIKILSLDGKIH